MNDPKDLGGATNLRVSLRFLKSARLFYGLNRNGVVDARDIRLIKLGDVQQTYWAQLWNLVRGDDLPLPFWSSTLR